MSLEVAVAECDKPSPARPLRRRRVHGAVPDAAGHGYSRLASPPVRPASQQRPALSRHERSLRDDTDESVVRLHDRYVETGVADQPSAHGVEHAVDARSWGKMPTELPSGSTARQV